MTGCMGWNQVRWTEAHQIASLMGTADAALPDPGIAPEQHFRSLRGSGERSAAVAFLAHALPRLEALAWAARVLGQEAQGRTLPRPDRQALDLSMRWLGDASDQNRRAAMDAAELADDKSPERMLALGVFLSGGSISQPDLPPIAPDPALAGRCAGGAITIAAHRNADHVAVFDRALDIGDRVAAEGLKALETA